MPRQIAQPLALPKMASLASASIAYWLIMRTALNMLLPITTPQHIYLSIAVTAALLALGLIVPMVILIYIANGRVQCAIFIALAATLYAIMAFIPFGTHATTLLLNRDATVARGDFKIALYVALFSFSMFPPILLAIAPAGPLARRLSFIILGVGILLELNEISKHTGSIKEILKLAS